MNVLRPRLLATAALVAAAGALTACGGGSAADDADTISIVGFAVPEAANKAIADEFTQTPEGEGVGFTTSYGASGDQSRAVVDGLDADYVHLSVGTDVDRLVENDLVDASWDDGPTKGIVSTSVVVLGVRDGNPKGIRGWDDLARDDVEIVTANPASSGAARWNALAAWGHITENGGTEQEATQFVDDVFANVVSLTNSGRDATQSFLGGTGDVLLAYENEAILAAQNGNGFEYVIPETTVLIENPGTVLKDASPKAQDWLDFVLGEQGQKQFALTGFRPVDTENPGIVDLAEYDLAPADIEGAPDPQDPFPEVQNLLTLEKNFDGPGWGAIADTLFADGSEGEPGIITRSIEKSGKASS